MPHNDVVAHYLDGSLVKGVCLNADPRRPSCHIQTPDQGMVEVRFDRLKALFYVKSLEGDPRHQERNHLEVDDPRRVGSRAVEMRFKDGERLVAFTPNYSPRKTLFYAVPADADTNNVRILVNQASCDSVKMIAEGAKAD